MTSMLETISIKARTEEGKKERKLTRKELKAHETTTTTMMIKYVFIDSSRIYIYYIIIII